MKQYRVKRGQYNTKYHIEIRTVVRVPNGTWDRRFRGAPEFEEKETIRFLDRLRVYDSSRPMDYPAGPHMYERVTFNTIAEAEKKISSMIHNDNIDNTYEGDWRP